MNFLQRARIPDRSSRILLELWDTKESEPVLGSVCEAVIKYSELPIMSDASDGSDVTEVTV